MKKKLIVGLLSFVLIFGLGTTAYLVYAHGNDSDYKTLMESQGIDVDEMESFMEKQGVDVNQMYEIMNSNNWDKMQKFIDDIDFEQMLPYMQKVHPTLNKQELEDMYNDCKKTNGSAFNRSYRGMMN